MPRAKVIKEPVFKRQKTAQLYQQTFHGYLGTSWRFQFSRIYKSKPENRLLIKVIQCVAATATNDKKDDPIIISLTNGADINGKCNEYLADATNNIYGTTANPFILGIVGSPAHPSTMTGSPTLIVNDLPLNQMTISVKHSDFTNTGNVNCIVIFEIEEIEEV
jgi:hypothetical protein